MQIIVSVDTIVGTARWCASGTDQEGSSEPGQEAGLVESLPYEQTNE